VRLVFINRFYWPEEPATAQLLTDLAEGLASAGHTVTVIASRPSDGQSPRRERRNGVEILRVRGTRWGKSNLVGRAIDFLTFLCGAAIQVLRTVQSGDRVVAKTDPPVLGIVVSPLARLRGARVIHWIQDIHPEISVALSPGATSRLLARLLTPLRDSAWRSGAQCVVVGSDLVASVRGAGVPAERIAVIPNWAPAGLDVAPLSKGDALRAEWSLRGKFVVAYSGNLGRVHDLEPVVEVARLLGNDPRVAFVFIGAGAQRDPIERQTRVLGLTNVHFYPPQPRARLAETLALGDVHLVTLRAGCESLVFPSKLYGIAAVGRPVIAIAPRESELAAIVTKGKFGAAFGRDETLVIASHLRQLAHDRHQCAVLATAAVEFSRTQGRLPHALERWQALLARDAAC
jgi:colanic acid biosynthesis glycosyl transferase WcaI